jgi:hypothetical protein
MRELIGPIEISRAGLWGWRGWRRRWRRWRRWWRRWWASVVTIISLEGYLVAVDTLPSVKVDVILTTLSCLTLPELRLSVKRNRTITGNLESIVWILVLVTLEDVCWCCLTFIRQHANTDSKTSLYVYAYAYACLINTKQQATLRGQNSRVHQQP